MGNKNYLTDDEYKFIFERVPRLCLDFVIVKDAKILLAKRNINPRKGCWSLPGGMVRYKESLDEASKRILKGEVGLNPLERDLIGFIEFPDEVNEKGVSVHSVSMVFLTKLEEGEFIGNDHAPEVQFFESLPKNNNSDQAKFLKENWDKFIK